MVVGLDALVGTLLVVAVVLAPSGSRTTAALVAATFLGLYMAGRWVLRVHERAVDGPRGGWWPDAAWVAGLVLLWALLLSAAPSALWIAFPLMLLQMHVLGPRWGIPAVAVTTGVAVAEGILVQADAGDPWTGYALGPMLGAGVAVGVVLGIEAFVRESQTRQRTVEELTRARRHLAQAERERAVSDERARLARDIHDTLAQSLSAIELLLRAADTAVGSDDDRARSLVDRARGAARDGLVEARRVVHDLTPTDLERTTLVAALRSVADRAASGHDVGGQEVPTVSVQTTGTIRPLPVHQEVTLLRIAQSALANAVEHAGAHQIRVRLDYRADAVVLEVADDGRGFDPSALDGHRSDGRGFGLPAIRARVDEVGGTLALTAARDRGTVLAVTLGGTVPAAAR